MRKKIIDFTGIGADPEVFLFDTTNHEVVSAEGYIQGTKEHPKAFSKNKMFATSLDNVLAEFTIPPAKNVNEFIKFLERGLNYIKSTLPNNIIVNTFPAHSLNDKYLQTLHSQTFGCEPDVNAYTQFVTIRDEVQNKNLRSAGGHIHIGYKNAWEVYDVQNPDENVICNDVDRQSLVKALDLFIGIPSVILEPDNERKSLYGKAGCYRPKSYGLEYRTLSNYYIGDKELTTLVYNQTLKAIDYVNKESAESKELNNYVQNVINTNDKKEANYLIKELNIL